MRDLRLVPAALAAWAVGGALAGVPGAAEWAGPVALAGGILVVVLAVATVVAGRARVLAAATVVAARAQAVAGRGGRGPSRDPSRGTALAAVTLAVLAAAAPAMVIALGGPQAGEWDDLPDWATILEPLRAAFRDISAQLPGDGGILLTGLAIGDDSQVGPALKDAMTATSLTHLTAVSGANCAIVVGAVLMLGVVAGVGRRARIVVALVALALFVMLVTPQPSVVRAAVMAAIALVGLAASRPARGIPLLSLSVVAILVATPGAALELGFALSVLATAGLLVVARPLGELLARLMPRALALALSVPIAASVAVQPLIALLQPQLPTYGIVANVLAEPAVPLATVAGMIACLLAPVAPPLALAAAWVGWVPSAWIAAIATTFAGMPGAQLPWPPGAWGVALCTAIGVAVAVAALASGRRRLGALLALGAIAVGFAAALAAGTAVSHTGRPDDWLIAMCDVGQGDAALVRSRTADGGWATAEIDTGPDPGRLAACWADLGVTRVDLLVLTHYDRDHVGGTDAVLGHVGTAFVGPWDPEVTTDWPELLAAGGAEVVNARRGLTGSLGTLSWEIVWPRPEPATPDPGNPASVVIRFGSHDGSGLSSIFLGDLGAAQQAQLLGLGAGGAADVLKVAHHGSADMSPDLYTALAPKVAVIGVGADNGYGHPTAKTLDVLRGLGTTVGRTDTEGLLLVAREGDRAVLWRERDGDPFVPDGPAESSSSPRWDTPFASRHPE